MVNSVNYVRTVMSVVCVISIAHTMKNDVAKMSCRPFESVTYLVK